MRLRALAAASMLACLAAQAAAKPARPVRFSGPALGIHASHGSTYRLREYFDETDAYGTTQYENPFGAGAEFSWELWPGIAPLLAGDIELADRYDSFDYLLTVGPGVEGRLRPTPNLILFGQVLAARQFAESVHSTVLQFGGGVEFRFFHRAGLRVSVRGQRHLGDPTNPADCLGCTPAPQRYEVDQEPVRTLVGLQINFGPAKEMEPTGR